MINHEFCAVDPPTYQLQFTKDFGVLGPCAVVPNIPEDHS
jgi:hypothetical protein